MLKKLSKRCPEPTNEDIDSIVEELDLRSQREQISPQLNPESWDNSDWQRNHWISSEG